MLLNSKALGNTESTHATDLAGFHVEASLDVTVGDGTAQVLHNFGTIVTSVVTNDGGKLMKSASEGLDGESLLALDLLSKIGDGELHADLGVATTEDGLMVLDGRDEDADGVMKGALSLINNMDAGTADNNGAGLVTLAASEGDNLVLTEHELRDLGAATENIGLGVVEGGEDLGTEDGGESFHTVEVGVLNNHNTGVSKELLGIVINELSVDENVGLVGKDFVNLSLHLHLLGLLDLSDLHDGVDSDLRAEDLNLVVVHGRVGDHDAGFLSRLLTAGGNLLEKNETISEVRVGQSTTGLLDDLDIIKVTGAVKAEHGVDGEVGEVISLRLEKLGGKGGKSNVLKVMSELFLIVKVVEGVLNEDGSGNLTSLSPALDDDLGMDLLHNEVLGLTEELTSEDSDGGGTITNLLVLSARNIDQDLGRWVVNEDRLKNGRTIVGDGDLLTSVLITERLEDLVHTLGTESGLDEVRDSNSANERLL